MKSKLLIFVIVSMTLLSMVGIVSADDWPTKPIRFIVPFSAGGSTDLFCRTLAPFLSEELGVDVVVENVPGAGTQVGLTSLCNAEPDGYTISEASQPHKSFTIAVQKAPYNLDNFAWLNMQHEDPQIINVMKEKPWKDIKDLFAYIKEHPGEIAIGCTQMSGSHVLLLYLQEKFDLDYIIVPYPGGGEGRAALIGGHLDAYFANALSNYFSIKDQTRALAIGGNKRMSLWPDTPTFHELYNDPELDRIVNSMASFRGLVVPREFKEKYPERFNKLVDAYNSAFHSPEHKKVSDKIGQTPIMQWTGPEKAEQMSAETNKIVQEYAHYFDN